MKGYIANLISENIEKTIGELIQTYAKSGDVSPEEVMELENIKDDLTKYTLKVITNNNKNGHRINQIHKHNKE